tara:strand:+ start:2635 stop:3291 length:657 start_codon:yes stop_codon:yes gene_type:complete
LPEKPLILAFDTSAAHCAAALLSGEDVLASVEEPMAKGQGERLLGLCREILDSAGVDYSDLTAIAVGIGPGNFTGIRISVSAARGLALGLGIPSIGVSRLEALAYGNSGTVISCIDARQEKLFIQPFGTSDDPAPIMCGMDDLPKLPNHSEPTCVGFQAERLANYYNGKVGLGCVPIAEATARIAATRLVRVNPRPAPLYLRPADAAPARDTPPAILP